MKIQIKSLALVNMVCNCLVDNPTCAGGGGGGGNDSNNGCVVVVVVNNGGVGIAGEDEGRVRDGGGEEGSRKK